jgi:hypothetical protein
MKCSSLPFSFSLLSKQVRLAHDHVSSEAPSIAIFCVIFLFFATHSAPKGNTSNYDFFWRFCAIFQKGVDANKNSPPGAKAMEVLMEVLKKVPRGCQAVTCTSEIRQIHPKSGTLATFEDMSKSRNEPAPSQTRLTQ